MTNTNLSYSGRWSVGRIASIRLLQAITLLFNPNASSENRRKTQISITIQIQWNAVKKILKIPRKSLAKILSEKFLKRVILMKWENFGAFLSWLVRWEIFLTGFFLSEFHCNAMTSYLFLDQFNDALKRSAVLLYSEISENVNFRGYPWKQH
jgi:hypothetical protein